MPCVSVSERLYMQEAGKELRGVVATREVEFQAEGVIKHSFNLDNIEKWLAEGEGERQACLYDDVMMTSCVPGKYQQLALLQQDLLSLLKRASRGGKRQLAGEVGQSFLAARDKVCGDGRGQLWSTALTYTAE